MGARELVLLALLGALLWVSKMALAWLPNIEPVSLLLVVYTVVLGWRVLAPLYVYVAMELLIWGIGFWSICYTYVWLVLVLLAMVFRRMESPLGWAVLSGAFGLSFGALCALVYWVSGGWAFALSWWVSGIPFDEGNLLFFPCSAKILPRNRYPFLIIFYRCDPAVLGTVGTHKKRRKSHGGSYLQNTCRSLKLQKDLEKTLGLPPDNRHMVSQRLRLQLIKKRRISFIQGINISD